MSGLAAAVLFMVPALGAGAKEARRYRVDPEKSAIDVRVGTAGLLKFAGHEHDVRVPVAEGEIVADAESLAASSVRLRFSSGRIRVVGGEGPADEIPKVQAKMASAAVLGIEQFPEAGFESRRVSGTRKPGTDTFELDVEGELELRKVRKPVSAHLVVELRGRTLGAKGTLKLRQTDFGIQPISVGGVVKVKNELTLAVDVVATAEGGE